MSATPYDRSRCTACHGTGQVLSGLGGSEHPVQCPWCEGSGVFIPGHDAQAARQGREPEPVPSG